MPLFVCYTITLAKKEEMTDSTAKHLVFVYGSLKEGFGNHHCLDGATKVAEAITGEARFTMKSLGGFPGVYDTGEGCQSVWGEIYKVDDRGLARCDRLEGHPTFYCRRKHTFVTTDGEVMTAWIYLLPISDLDRFEGRSGDHRVEYVDLDDFTVVNWLPRQPRWY